MIIAGPSWRGHREEREKIVAKESILDVEFAGPVYGEEKRRLYGRASLFVMSSYSENFGGTVLEALSESTPVITTTDVDWELLAEEKCGWWVKRADMASTLIQAMNMPGSERMEIGMRGRKLVARMYSWNSVADKIEKAYLSIVNNESAATPPSSSRTGS